jgi:TRAP-type C4-dicarboxylate transport system permease small subunit
MMIFSCLIFFFVVSQVLIGWRYSSACPVNQLISHYLIVAGIVGLVLIMLISITQIMTRTFAKKMGDDTIDKSNPNRSTMLVGCGVCSIMCINLSLFIFLLGWAVVGWIWVIEVWHRVQYHHAERNDYCHPMLYQFTFSLLLLTTTFKLILFSFICRKTCTRVTSRQRKGTMTSDDA